jgi:hypothetical protein
LAAGLPTALFAAGLPAAFLAVAGLPEAFFAATLRGTFSAVEVPAPSFAAGFGPAAAALPASTRSIIAATSVMGAMPSTERNTLCN